VPGAPSQQRGEYGFDAPHVPVLLAVAAATLLLIGVLNGAAGGVFGGLFMLASAASFVYATRRGKFVLWRALLRDLELEGGERVLDLGCGRGAVLTMAAALLPAGRVVGVDVWRTVDQSGNSEATTRRNAELEGVADRVELLTADMTKLPFDGETFDIVLSSLAIHNIKRPAGRSQAIDEAVRVMAPGARLVVADIGAASDYADRLRELGMADVALRGLGWRGWYGGPWMATRAVTARKPPIAAIATPPPA
jgi:SAM-dependent methyltransferase